MTVPVVKLLQVLLYVHILFMLAIIFVYIFNLTKNKYRLIGIEKRKISYPIFLSYLFDHRLNHIFFLLFVCSLFLLIRFMFHRHMYSGQSPET